MAFLISEEMHLESDKLFSELSEKVDSTILNIDSIDDVNFPDVSDVVICTSNEVDPQLEVGREYQVVDSILDRNEIAVHDGRGTVTWSKCEFFKLKTSNK